MEIATEVFDLPPEDFVSEVDVAACYIRCRNRVLLLKRAPDKPQGGTWGVPAGKSEPDEEAQETVKRELLEEVGLSYDPIPLGTLYVRHPDLHFTYHIFYHSVLSFPEINLSPEHTEYVWATREEAKALPLIGGGIETLDYFLERTDS